MKKLLLLFSALTVIFQASLFAQKARFGVQAGATYANMVLKAENVSVASGMKFGATAGFIVDKPLSSHFIFQPSINFVQKGASSKELIDDAVTILNYIEIPVNFLYRQKASNGFFVGAGPTVGYGISGQMKDQDEKVDLKFGSDENKDDLARMDFGGNLFGGYLFNNGLQVAFSYNRSFSNLVLGEDASILKFKNNYFSLKVGYFFKRG